MEFSRREYWSGLLCPSPGNVPDPGTELRSPILLHCRWILYRWATRDGEGNVSPLWYSAWKLPWAEEPGGLQSMRSLPVRHSWATSLSLPFHALEKAVATHSSVPAWRSPGIAQSGVAQSRTRRKRLSRAEPPGKHCCSFSDGCSGFLHVLQLCGFPYALSMVFYPTCYNSLFIRTSYKLVGYLRLLFISSSWELKHLWRLSVIVNIILQMIQA